VNVTGVFTVAVAGPDSVMGRDETSTSVLSVPESPLESVARAVAV
jgi:hypothetical protein